jgi:Cdc6-like AAA superfamily ATPase
VGYSSKVARLKQWIKGKPCVIALDEFDKLNKKDLNDVLYMLKEFEKTGIACISNSRKYVLELDPRILSRTQFTSINFPRYSDEELLMILKHRVEDCHALFPNTYSKEILERTADLAAGDARIAIQTLRRAALSAETKNKSRISEEDVEKGYEEVKDIKKKYLLEKLGLHHRLIYEAVKNNPEITSTNLYELYKKEAVRQGLEPKSSRTINNYLDKLIELGHLRTDRAKTRGNVRLFVLA